METIFKVGTIFKITHCDGYVAHEVIAKVVDDVDGPFYVCESCAVYTNDDFKQPDSFFKLIVKAI